MLTSEKFFDKKSIIKEVLTPTYLAEMDALKTKENQALIEQLKQPNAVLGVINAINQIEEGLSTFVKKAKKALQEQHIEEKLLNAAFEKALSTQMQEVKNEKVLAFQQTCLRSVQQPSFIEMMTKISGKQDKQKQTKNTKAQIITKDNLNDILTKNKFVLVDCWGYNCPSCEDMDPIIEKLVDKYSTKLVIGKANINENQKIAHQYRVRSIPTLLFFHHGKPINRLIGFQPLSIMEKAINQLFEK